MFYIITQEFLSVEQRIMQLSIIFPCYNEEENLSLILERFSKVIKGQDIEVILVDNGSTDNSAEILKKLLPNYSFARAVKVPVNQGYGYGILAGLKEAKGDFIGWTHADMQTDPQDVVKAYHLIEENNGNTNLYIKGTRRGRPLFDNVFTVGMGVFESIYLRTPLWEINAQPNIFHKSFFATWKKPPHDFSLDLYVYCLAKKQKLALKRFIVKFPPRIHGESKWNNSYKDKYKFIVRTLKFSKELKKTLKAS